MSDWRAGYDEMIERVAAQAERLAWLARELEMRNRQPVPCSRRR